MLEGNPFDRNCPTRQLLDRIGDQWTVLVIIALADGPLRFTEIATRIEGISQKVLSQTLRALVRDGMLTRTAYAEIPPRVVYELTPLGRDLCATVTYLDRWARAHIDQVEQARASFDRERAVAAS